MSVEVGVFVVPTAEDPTATIAQAVAAAEAGLDVIAIQDHPYQRRSSTRGPCCRTSRREQSGRSSSRTWRTCR
jgi:hypothetical protein